MMVTNDGDEGNYSPEKFFEIELFDRGKEMFDGGQIFFDGEFFAKLLQRYSVLTGSYSLMLN